MMIEKATTAFQSGSLALPFLMALSLGACGHATATQPHEMSVAQHQQAAAGEQSESATHSSAYDAESREKMKRCAPSLAANRRICWNEYVNPTSEHEEVAKRHREGAAQHRAASQRLLSAEKAACAGLDADDRDVSPFAHAGDIQSVRRLSKEGVRSPEAGDPIGVTIVFRAVPGLTAPWLQRIIDCHLARNAALGHEVASAEMPYCPLTLKSVRAVARESGSGFAVDVWGEDAATAEEVWRRAERLAPDGK